MIINVRLGVELIDPIYASILPKYMDLPHFAGLIGG